ncbi:hypothetical protein M0R45_030248 [Rubus argutus]|uniref:Uncharacterized protein n=1 Tax=Rubus argutus TaxID=59490 RepID=A0AAW1WAQ9_RUBAR
MVDWIFSFENANTWFHSGVCFLLKVLCLSLVIAELHFYVRVTASSYRVCWKIFGFNNSNIEIKHLLNKVISTCSSFAANPSSSTAQSLHVAIRSPSWGFGVLQFVVLWGLGAACEFILASVDASLLEENLYKKSSVTSCVCLVGNSTN